MLPNLPTPSPAWVRRLTLGTSLATAFIASMPLLAAFFGLARDSLGLPGPLEASSYSTFALLLLALTLITLAFGHRRTAFLAIAPGLYGLFALVQHSLASGAPPAAAPHAATSLCLLLSGASIPWLYRKNTPASFAFILASIGSIKISIGLATLLGHALNLVAITRWTTSTPLAQDTALILLTLGFAELLIAWRRHQREQHGTPAWLPLPLIAGALTLTFITWRELRERELAYLGYGTQEAVNTLASQLQRSFDTQSSTLERIARRWNHTPEQNSPTLWETDAHLYLTEQPSAHAVLLLTPTGTTHWLFPTTLNETLLGLNHALDPTRDVALRQSLQTRAPALTPSHPTAHRTLGYTIYAPLFSEQNLLGYIAAEHSYPALLKSLDQRLSLSERYHIVVSIGPDILYQNAPASHATGQLQSIFTLQDRRIRIELTPTATQLRQNRRLLPEIALASGIGITFLLALSIHLARTARSGQRHAELINQRLLAENDQRRQVEARLKHSEERLHLALESSQIAIFEWNLPSNSLLISPLLWELLGYDPATTTNPSHWTTLIHPEDIASYRLAIEEQLAGKSTTIDTEYRVRSASHVWHWLHARAKTITRSKSGTPTQILGTLQDITPRKKAEHTLRAAQATTRKLSLVASNTDNLVLITQPNAAIEWANTSFEQLTGYGLDEIRGRNPAGFLVGPKTNPRTVRRIRAAVALGRPLTTEILAYSKTGHPFHLHLELRPVLNENNEVENFIAIAANITTRVETENALRRAKSEAEAATQAKSDFLASMSHEIRTPMNGVIGMTSLLLDTSLNQEQSDFVATIRTSGEALLTIINDILDFSKIESGKMELEQAPFELSTCIEEALELFALPAAKKHIELAYHLSDTVPTWINGDVTRLRQIIVNLVNNAVKFTPHGRISIEVTRVGAFTPGSLAPNAPLTLQFAITDSGIGIPPERIDRLFRPFSHVDSSTTRKYGGTGLGLAICHRLAQLMGGSIHVTSTVAQGSTFTFTINASTPDIPAGWGFPELPNALSYAPILCIDENPIALRRYLHFFHHWGATTLSTTSPALGLTLLSRTPAPAAMLIDASTLSDKSYVAQLAQTKLPLLLLHPTGHPPALPAALQKQPVALIPKPARNINLIRGVLHLFDQRPASHLPLEASETPLSEEVALGDILLVEDNPINQKVALRFLQRLGYRANAVGNGFEAIAALETFPYRLVLMDLMMPEMDGFEATVQIRGRFPKERQPKIVALTANAIQGDRERCLAAGMDDYITKPVKLVDIAAAIRRQFQPGTRPPFPPSS